VPHEVGVRKQDHSATRVRDSEHRRRWRRMRPSGAAGPAAARMSME
jgi:hypothetical protein